MSGYPQGPYGGPPQFAPPGQMPPGQVPPGQFPPGQYPPGGMMPMPKTSAAAVTALVMGLLFCIPGITSLGAVLFGFIGISKTKNPMVRGRGMAIAGLILGIIGVLGWGGCGGIGIYSWMSTSADRTVAQNFMQDVSAGKLTEATALVEPGVDTTSLKNFVTTVQAGGPIGMMIPVAVPGGEKPVNGGTKPVVAVTETWSSSNGAQHQALLEITAQPDGSRKVASWQMIK
jgi:hypothetical protein